MKKVVVITGDSSGFGMWLANEFSKDSIVYGISRRHLDSNYKHYEADVQDYELLQKIVKEIYDKEGHIDLLIASAGLGVAGAVEVMSKDDINLQNRVNFDGVVNINKAVLPYMRMQRSGRIINISSVAAIAPMPFQAMYSASKAAVNAYSMALQNEVKPFGIDVSAVMPGDAKTGFTSARRKVEDKENLYNDRVARSTNIMEQDELNGDSLDKVSKKIYKYITRRHIKPLYTVCFKYQVLVFLMKILSAKLVNKVLYKMYAK